MSEHSLPTVIRATDAHWTDRKHHDRLILRAAGPDRMYQFEGWIRFGEDAGANAFNVIAGVSRQDRETGRLTIFIESHAGRWKPIGFASLSDPTHLEVSLTDPQGAPMSFRARLLDTLPLELRGRLRGQVSIDDDEVARFDLDTQSPTERRSHFKVV